MRLSALATGMAAARHEKEHKSVLWTLFYPPLLPPPRQFFFYRPLLQQRRALLYVFAPQRVFSIIFIVVILLPFFGSRDVTCNVNEPFRLIVITTPVFFFFHFKSLNWALTKPTAAVADMLSMFRLGVLSRKWAVKISRPRENYV